VNHAAGTIRLRHDIFLDSRFRLPAMLRMALQAGGNDKKSEREINLKLTQH